MKRQAGYTFIILMAMITVLAIGLLAAVPVWKTQIQREAEEELIFRGRQYVEAVRIYQIKNPGKFPASIDDLIKARCLRKPFPDPMTRDGKWDLILQADSASGGNQASSGRGAAARTGQGTSAAGRPAVNRIFVVPQESVRSVENARILGVVSRSTKTSLRIYNDRDTYDAWLFFYGQSPDSEPEIIRFGRTDK
ncbi:MAG: type II secretion system protein [Candidatus Aminicenantes bacterium]|nr:type II secretion system protein [Candidatus Aminicenantes bacterium]